MAMHPISISDDEYQRLIDAKKTGTWKNLQSWKERYLYQRLIATHAELIEIASLAK